MNIKCVDFARGYAIIYEMSDFFYMINSLFSSLDIFMLRTPLLPLNTYFEWLNFKKSDAEFLKSFFKCSESGQFRESLKITSPSLYRTLEDFLNNKEVKNKEYFLNSIFKYFIRATTRCTPFGLFAGVSFGTFTKSNTELILRSPTLLKAVSVDMEWICGVIKKIEEEFYKKIRYRKNEGIYIKGDRAVLLNVEKKDKNLIMKKNISLTPALKLIFNATENYVTFDEILLNLQNNYPNQKISILEKYIKELIDNDYLVSILRPSLGNENILKKLIETLEELGLGNVDLKNILSYMQKYQDESNPRNAIEVYKKLKENMKMQYKSPNYIQVDSKSDFKSIKINKNLVSELNDLMRILLILNDKNISHDAKWQRYKTKFIEKYGETRKVPLLELLDEDLGLGVPEGYLEEPAENKTKWLGTIGQGLKEFFFNKLENALIKKEEFMEIKDSDFNDYELSNIDNIPKSFDINLSLVKDKFGKNKYYIGNGIGALRAGNSFGRFFNIMDNPVSLFRKINQKTSYNDVLNCELRFLPPDTRHANVSHCATASDYEIAISCSSYKSRAQRLPLDDIVIGIKDFKFYAKSVSENKIVNFTINSMFNRHLFPSVFRFLWDVTIDQEIPWCLFYWDLFFYHYDYVPEIRYKNFVLSPRKWALSKNFFHATQKINFEEFNRRLSEFIDCYSVNRFVYFGELDNRLLLDLENQRCKKILYSYFTKSERIALWEYDGKCLPPVSYKDKKYCCELFIPFVKEKKCRKENDIAIYIPNSYNKRIKIPFDEWIYIKVYGANGIENSFISKDVSKLVDSLFENKIIDKFFFLRYSDPRRHIRIRFHGESGTLLKGYSVIQYWIKNLLDRRVATDFIIDTYDRELERYGGEHVINEIETLFFKSSLSVINLLNFKKSNELTDYYLGVICTLYFVKNFNLTLEDTLTLFDVPNSKFREHFKKEREKYIFAAESLFYNDTHLSDESKDIISILSVMGCSIELVKKQLKNLNITKIKYIDIVSSIIHMHLNRLFENNLQIEPIVRAITRHTIYAAYKKTIHNKS